MRPVRSFLAMLMKRFGAASAIALQTPFANAFASAQLGLAPSTRASGVTTCRPFPPVVLQKPIRPSVASRSRTSLAGIVNLTDAGANSVLLSYDGKSSHPWMDAGLCRQVRNAFARAHR